MASLNHIVANLFHIPVAEINDDISPRTVKAWDSMKHIELILMIEQEFSVRFEPSQVPVLTNLGSIRKILIESGVKKEQLS